jgi:hypothetical protein
MSAPQVTPPAGGGAGDITPAAGAIQSLTLTNAGSGGTAGSYREQALTTITGSGSGATADINITGGVVNILGLRAPGSGYAAGDTLSATISGLTGAVFTVATVVTSNNTTGNVTANRIAAGATNPTAGITTNAGFVSTTAPLIFSSSFSGGTTQYRTGLLVNMDGEPLFQSAVTASEASTITGAGFIGRWNLSARTTNTTVNGVNAFSSIATPNASGTSTSYGGQFYSIYSGATFTGATTNGVGVYSQVSATASIGANTFSTFYAYDANVSCTSTSIQTISNAGYLVPRAASFSGAAHAIGNFYGVYLPTTTLSGGATITNRYGVFQQDTAATNVFAASTSVGTATAPTSNTLDVSAAGWGIKLNGSPTNGNANTLDCYVEANWSPADASGAGMTLTQTGGVVARYTQIGRQVVCFCDITYPATILSGGSDAAISLPVAASGAQGGHFVGGGSTALWGLVSGANLLLYNFNTLTRTTNTTLGASRRLIFTLSYFVS